MSNLSSYNLNTTSTSNGRVTSTIGKRVAVDSLFLPIQQSVAVNVKTETLIVNSSTAPMWGSSHTFNLCEKGIALNDITLKLELPPLSGYLQLPHLLLTLDQLLLHLLLTLYLQLHHLLLTLDQLLPRLLPLDQL